MKTLENNDTQESLILENQGLVITLVKHFNPPTSTEFDEYVQVGDIGLWKAAQKYDKNRGAFSTIAWHCIRNEIIRYIQKEKKHSVTLIDNSILDNKSVFTPNSSFSENLPASLTEKEVKVISLRLAGYTFVEIGEINNISKGGASNIYKRAIKKIRISNKDDSI